MTADREDLEIIASDRKQRIAAAAVDVVTVSGLSGLSMQRVAERAGLAKSVVLYHVADRQGLLRIVVAEVARLRRLGDQALTEEHGDPRRHLGDWLDRQFDAATRPDAPQRLAWLIQLDGEIHMDRTHGATRSLTADAEQEVASRLAKLLARGQAHACWQAPDATRTATAVKALVDGFLLQAFAARDNATDFQRLRAICRGAVMDLLVR